MGFDAVVSAMDGKGFSGVILAGDVSEKTEKEVRFYAERSKREVVKTSFSMDEANAAIGKRTGVFLVCDEGLFGTIKKHITTGAQLL